MVYGGMFMRNRLFMLLAFIFCFSFITVCAKNTKYVEDGDTVIIQNDNFGKFDLGCPFNGNCKNIIVKGNLNSDDLRLLCMCSRECETLNLSDVHVTDKTEIPMWCFIDVYNLKEIKLPYGLKSIGDSTFCNCVCLENVLLPSSLENIGNGSFQNCPKLKMKIPSTVEIGERAFLGCPNVVVLRRLDSELSRKSYFSFSSILSWVGL